MKDILLFIACFIAALVLSLDDFDFDYQDNKYNGLDILDSKYLSEPPKIDFIQAITPIDRVSIPYSYLSNEAKLFNVPVKTGMKYKTMKKQEK